ncbi:MAG: DUF488 domain-containing protein [Candidatus Saccharimonadales bacterium]
MTTSSLTIFTVGHSTHPIDEFIELLRAHGVTQLIDIRTVPKSRHNPQFMQDSLEKTMPDAAIRYRYMANLGGLRHTTKESINTAWRNASFRGYADYMQTDDFAAGIDELIQYTQGQPTAIMCAEAVPWRCHRSMVGDALVVRGGVQVRDIMTPTSAKPHTLTSFASVDGNRVFYPQENITTQ